MKEAISLPTVPIPQPKEKTRSKIDFDPFFDDWPDEKLSSDGEDDFGVNDVALGEAMDKFESNLQNEKIEYQDSSVVTIADEDEIVLFFFLIFSFSKMNY
jgi:hypothetical protein